MHCGLSVSAAICRGVLPSSSALFSLRLNKQINPNLHSAHFKTVFDFGTREAVHPL